MNRTDAEIIEIEPLTDTIIKVKLSPKTYLPYEAGQYLNIIANTKALKDITQQAPLSYSIANAPLGAHYYELHIRHTQDNQKTRVLLEEMKQSGVVRIELPLGQCSIARLNPLMPLCMIAAGTGFAPIHAMIESFFAGFSAFNIDLFWVVQSKSDLYYHTKLLEWADRVKTFRYHPYIRQEGDGPLIERLVMQYGDALSRAQYVLSGPFEMVFELRDALKARQVPEAQLFSDAFEFEGKL